MTCVEREQNNLCKLRIWSIWKWQENVKKQWSFFYQLVFCDDQIRRGFLYIYFLKKITKTNEYWNRKNNFEYVKCNILLGEDDSKTFESWSLSSV